MLFNLGNIINESQNNNEEILPTNEGFTFEGGFENALMLAEESHHAIKMAGLNCDLYASASLMEAVKTNTLSESAIDSAYILQEKVLGSLFENLRNMLRKLAGRVKEVIKTLGMHFDKVFNKKGYLSSAKDKLKTVTNFGDAKIEGYTYTQGAIDPVNIYNKMAAKAKSEFDGIFNSVKDADKVEDARKENETAIKSYEEFKSEEFIDTLAKEAGADDRADYIAYLYKTLRDGKDSKEEIKIDGTSKAFGMLDGFKTAQATLNGLSSKVDTLYGAAKKTIDEAEKKHNKTSAEAKDGKKVVAELKLKLIQTWADRTAKASVMANEAIKAKLGALKEEQSQNYSLISKAMGGAKKADKDAKLDESGSDALLRQFMPNILR